MRNVSDWRMRHNERIKNYFFPDFIYPPSEYPAIIPHCAIPNYWSHMNYEIEDLLDKKFKYEVNKQLLIRDGYYPQRLLGGSSNSNDLSFKDISEIRGKYNYDYKTFMANHTPRSDPMLERLYAIDKFFVDHKAMILRMHDEDKKNVFNEKILKASNKVDRYFEDETVRNKYTDIRNVYKNNKVYNDNNTDNINSINNNNNGNNNSEYNVNTNIKGNDEGDKVSNDNNNSNNSNNMNTNNVNNANNSGRDYASNMSSSKDSIRQNKPSDTGVPNTRIFGNSIFTSGNNNIDKNKSKKKIFFKINIEKENACKSILPSISQYK